MGRRDGAACVARLDRVGVAVSIGWLGREIWQRTRRAADILVELNVVAEGCTAIVCFQVGFSDVAFLGQGVASISGRGLDVTARTPGA